MKPSHKAPKHVVVIGGGFTGLWCVRGLAKTDILITLIDRANVPFSWLRTYFS